ncbi:MAG: serine protease, partial [Mesorhizobium sp.]
MHLKRLFLIAVCTLAAFAAAPGVRQALAEDAAKPADPGLSDVLTDLLHGVEGENATSGPD